jgi:DNA-binding GntR family transcriptional regulator
MDHYSRMDDRRSFRVPHRAFHDRLVHGAGERVRTAISQLFDHAERYRLAFGAVTPERWDQRREENRMILDAAASGDADLTARRLVAHYAQTAALVFAAVDPGHDLASLRTTIRTVAPGAEGALTEP